MIHHDTIPIDLLSEGLADLGVPLEMTVARPPAEDRAISDLWTALGGELKPSLDLVVNAPMEAGMLQHAAGLVRETPRIAFGAPGIEPRPTTAKKRRPAAHYSVEGPVDPMADETIVAGDPKEPGRSLRVRTLPRIR
jgi:hypothetical protein